MKTMVSVRNLTYRPLLAISGAVAILLCALICFGSSYLFGLQDAQIASADSLKPSTSQQSDAGGQAVSKTTQRSKQSAGVSKAVSEPVETCVPYSGSLTPSAVPLSDGSTGLTQQIDQPSSYQIFGRTSDTLRSQIRQCAPLSAGDDSRYAAETTYNLTWRYQYINVGNDQCQVANASVGIHVSQILPVWRPDSKTSPKLVAAWNTFATALNTHENGHVGLDLQYAQNLLNDLRSLPATPCSQIQEAVRHLTDSDSAMLAQANDNYDSTTNHGATQGAILP